MAQPQIFAESIDRERRADELWEADHQELEVAQILYPLEVDDVVVGEVLQGRAAAFHERMVGGHGQNAAAGEYGGPDGEVGFGDGQPQHVRVVLSAAQRGEGVGAVDLAELYVAAGVAGAELVDKRP